jgi:hypothetical protein
MAVLDEFWECILGAPQVVWVAPTGAVLECLMHPLV